ncbi:MAG TPA: hypothetical protein VMT34_15715 [Aggregatilineales bacterium]|nr:hypothetical protein [Aggregatilineales bacterium]
MVLTVGATVATLIGGQTLAFWQKTTAIPTASAPTTAPVSVQIVKPSETSLPPAAPQVVIISNINTPAKTIKRPSAPSQTGGQNNVIVPPPPAIVASVGGGGGVSSAPAQPAPASHSSR